MTFNEVNDIYVEYGFNSDLLTKLEPVMFQIEEEADLVGMEIASVAGFSPGKQLLYLENQSLKEVNSKSLLLASTHPPYLKRFNRAKGFLPLMNSLLKRGYQKSK